MTGTSKVLEEDDDMMSTCHVKKKIKTPELSEITASEINMEDTGTSSHDLLHEISTFSDQPTEIESLESCCNKSTSEKGVIFEDGIPKDVVENKLLEKSSSFETTLLNNGEKVVTENDVIFNEVSVETHTEDALITNRGSCNEDIIANKPLEQLHDEAKEIEEHDSDKLDDNPSSSQLDGLKDLASQDVNETVNVDRAFSVNMRKKLLVLDVNGLLIDICSYVPYDYDWDDIILKKAVFKRPYCDDFLKFCFERFNVGFWTSKTKRNMEPILDFLLGDDKRKLLFTWDQSHCTYTGFNTVEKRHKPLLLKKLKKLWDKCDPDLPWERGEYNESNTLLIDDSPYKALCNPRYSAIFPNTYRFRDLRDSALGFGGDLRVYLEGLSMAENVQEYVKQNPFGQRPITEKNLSWGFYSKVIEAGSSPPRETDNQHQPDNVFDGNS